MSEIKPGDRMRVEYEGRVVQIFPTGAVEIRTGNGLEYLADKRHGMVIVPPVNVGDPVTANNIDRLPDGTIVRAGRRVFVSYVGKWYEAGNAYGYPPDRITALGAVIVWLPDEEGQR